MLMQATQKDLIIYLTPSTSLMEGGAREIGKNKRRGKMEISFVNKTNLIKGINNWNKHPRWDPHFHNDLYQTLYSFQQRGFTIEYWRFLVDELARWIAIRGTTKEDIFQRGLIKLSSLEANYRASIINHRDNNPNLYTVKWDEIKSLFHTALQIKKTSTPSIVFASKLCHFILPDTFIVVDSSFNEGAEDEWEYEDYWKECQEAWINCTDREELIMILSEKIGPGVIKNFPFSTKITELCSSGS
jgi:hypothetical protein